MNSKTKIAFDAFLMVVFLLLMDPRSVGGMEFHEWVGLGICIFFIVHKIFNWSWIRVVTKSLFTKLPARVRLNYLLDVLLLAGMISIILSGMMISKTIDFSWLPIGGDYLFWRFLHTSGAVLTIAVVGVHVGMHWKWIGAMTKKTVAAVTAHALKGADHA